jgi:hypothetical protein
MNGGGASNMRSPPGREPEGCEVAIRASPRKMSKRCDHRRTPEAESRVGGATRLFPGRYGEAGDLLLYRWRAARQVGATLVSENLDDFELLRRYVSFDLAGLPAN